jgi:magnesium transporter
MPTIINCFQISDELQLLACDYQFAVNAIKKQNARIWIDIQEMEPGDLEMKLDDLDVKGLARHLCLLSRDHPGFYPMKTLAFLVVPVQAATAERSRDMAYLAMLCQNDFLLTIRDSLATRFQHNATLQESGAWLADSSIAGLISSILIGLSLDSLRKTVKLRDMIMALEEQTDREPGSVGIEELSGKRSELLTLESVVHGQLPILKALISTDRASINFENTREHLIWATANLESADRTLEWLERRIEAMRIGVDMHAQDNTNRRLGRLTVLSMVFMPLTLLAGIWGMNFTGMPELTWSFGYPIALGSMFILATGMYFYFRDRGWFD